MNDFSIKKNKRVLKEIKKNVKKGKKKSWSAHAKFDFFWAWMARPSFKMI